MSEYLDRDLLVYNMQKMASIDGQPRAFRRAIKLVELFPKSDVYNATPCQFCCHWDILNDHLDNEGNIIAKCAWFSRQGNYIETSSKDFCSFGCIRTKGGKIN